MQRGLWEDGYEVILPNLTVYEPEDGLKQPLGFLPPIATAPSPPPPPTPEPPVEFTSPALPAPTSCRDAYNTSMRQTLGSKLFFLDKLPMREVGLVVDFGCADGHLMKMLHRADPEPSYMGVECDPQQRSRCNQHFPEVSLVYPSLGEIDRRRPSRARHRRGDLLIMSSVLHEVFSAPGFRWGAWWREIERQGFRYIAIRDFGLSASAYGTVTPPGWLSAIYGHGPTADLLDSFEATYGDISQLSACLHFLLKYRYGDNWEREMAENYIAFSREELVDRMTASGAYRPLHINATSTRHFREHVEEDFGIDIAAHRTHLEIVLERRSGA